VAGDEGSREGTCNVALTTTTQRESDQF
jgi:hypothetical protein